MRFLCLTDTEKIEVKPLGFPITTSFYAQKDIETLTKLVSCWEYGQPAFPVNPRLNKLPSMPEICNSATLLFTSGSTAEPKIACHSMENYLFSARGTNEVLSLGSNDRWLLSLPLFHVGGLAILFRCMLASATIVLSELPLIDSVLFHQITHLSLVPTQLYRLLQEPTYKIEQCARQLKSILLGGAPIAESLLKKAIDKGFNIHQTYGLTEMTAQITMDPYPGPLPFRELKIAQDGEILVKGHTLFQGYLNTPLILDQEGWFATRDLGIWTSSNMLRILGRKDNLFISGGENIQPEEIESALLSLPNIIEAIVVPKMDLEFGMRPIAFIEQDTKENNFLPITEMLKKKLPSYKIPIKFFSFPETSSLKRNRKELFELAQKLD
ncbi:MAG: AMP-binding protein [Chlamydiota bacterium]